VSGELANSTSGEHIIINNSSKTLGDGIIDVDERWIGSAYGDASVVVRYQDKTICIWYTRIATGLPFTSV